MSSTAMISSLISSTATRGAAINRNAAFPLALSAGALVCSALAWTPAASPPTAKTVRVVLPTDPPKEPEPELASPVPVVRGEDWTTFHNSSSRQGVSRAPSIQHPAIRWKARVGIQGWLNSPVVLGDLVLVPSSGSHHNTPDKLDGLHALDLATGKARWFAPTDLDADGVATTKRTAFVSCDDGKLYAFGISDGKLLSKQSGQGEMFCYPLVVGEQVIVGDAGGYLRSFNVHSGAPIWKHGLAGEIRGGASADDTTIYVSSTGGTVAAFDFDGKERWKRVVTRPAFTPSDTPKPIVAYPPPVITARAVIVSFARDTTYDHPAILALKKTSGRLLWQAAGRDNHHWANIRSTPVFTGGNLVYAEAYSGDIVALNSTTGKLAARKTVGSCLFPNWASPVAASGIAYVPPHGRHSARHEGQRHEPAMVSVSWRLPGGPIGKP